MTEELVQMRKLRRFLVALTVLNVFCVLFVILGAQPKAAWASGDDQVVRCRALQVVDAQGKVRAGLTVLPADPGVKMPDGGTMEDTVIFRLIDPKGRPEVKMTASESGAGLLLMGRDDHTFVRMRGHEAHSSIELTDKAGHLKDIQP